MGVQIVLIILIDLMNKVYQLSSLQLNQSLFPSQKTCCQSCGPYPTILPRCKF